MMNQFTPKQKFLLILLPALVVGTIIYTIVQSSGLKAVSSDPRANGKINVYNSLVITYNDEIVADKADISTSPSFKFTTKANAKQLIISPTEHLTNNTTYTVTAGHICKKSHPKTCTDYMVTFSTDNTIPYQSQSATQQQQVVAGVDAQYQQVPILAILPVRETDFVIDARPSAEFTYIVITPSLVSTNLNQSEYTTAYNKFYAEGQQYLQSKGYKLEGDSYKVVSSNQFQGLNAGD